MEVVDTTSPEQGETDDNVEQLENEPPEVPTTRPLRSTDIWRDAELRDMVLNNKEPPLMGATALKALRRRAANYTTTEDGDILRHLINGTTRTVPRLEARTEALQKVHAASGHSGMTRTESLARRTYWWPTIGADCRQTVRNCDVCDRVHASRGGTQKPHLRPTPIRGMGYKWGVDWAGGFPESKLGNKHLFIAIEYTTKWMEVWPAATKDAATSAFLFKALVIARYGAPAQVLSDGGPEFENWSHAQRSRKHLGQAAAEFPDCLPDHQASFYQIFAVRTAVRQGTSVAWRAPASISTPLGFRR